jgi:phosphopantothenoylcysteine decarboxylase
MDANTLAKISNGICDNLVTSIARAWEITNEAKRIIVAPSMNTQMWLHPFTSKQLKILSLELFCVILAPVEKKLVCGDIGNGAMASVSTIFGSVETVAKEIQSLRK